MQAQAAPLRIGIAGLGAVGKKLAETLDAGMDGLVLSAVAVRDTAKAQASLAHLQRMPLLTDIAGLAEHCDVVVECAPAVLLPAIARPVLQQGKTVVVLSSAALLSNMDLVDVAKIHGGAIVVPTGALLGLDAVCAAAQGHIESVRMITRKPVKGLLGAKYLVDNNIQIEGITEPLRIFKGSPREAAEGFAANLNVAVALSLAGIGPDRTTLEVWADPHIDKNMHRVEVVSDAALFSMEIQNIPTENPKTGRITALSVIAALRKMRAPLRVGT
ncbi:MAG: aspartate dehydrogenase [Comamonas sp.]